MTLDTRTPQEIAYDSQRDGSAYFKAQPDETIDTSDAWEEIIDHVTARSSDGPSRQAFGALADGTPIQCDLWNGERQGVVSAELDGWLFCVDDSGFVAGGSTDKENSVDFDGVSIEQLRTLAALVNAGVIDRLLAVAVAWGRGDTEPPQA